ncbi:ion transporter [Planctomycetaceae bacterium SH139]
MRRTMYEIIFEADTFWGHVFDICLLAMILASISVIALETVPSIHNNATLMNRLHTAEIVFSIIFGLEYISRLLVVKRPLRYTLSFWGLIDLVSFLPSLLVGLTTTQPGSFVILRSVRLLRIFRIMKLWRMLSEADELTQAVWQARDKIIVFLAVVMVAVTISGTLMYHVEFVPGEEGESISQFSSIPQSMYWAIVTMTTVGYGDIVPQTTAGKFVSAALILLGYSLIIVPSGFVSAELSAKRMQRDTDSARVCGECEKANHAITANFCDRCGAHLPERELT